MNNAQTTNTELSLTSVLSIIEDKKKEHANVNSIYQSYNDAFAQAKGNIVALEKSHGEALAETVKIANRIKRASKPETLERLDSEMGLAREKVKCIANKLATEQALAASHQERLNVEEAKLSEVRDELKTLETQALDAKDQDGESNDVEVSEGEDKPTELTENDVRMSTDYINALSTTKEKILYVNKVLMRGITRLRDNSDFSDIKRSLLLMVRESNQDDQNDFWVKEFKRVRSFISGVSPYSVVLKAKDGQFRLNLKERADRKWTSLPEFYWVKPDSNAVKSESGDKFLDFDKEKARIKKLIIDPEASKGERADLAREYLESLGLSDYFDSEKLYKEMQEN